MYKNLKHFLKDAKENKLFLHEAVIKEECLSTDKTRDFVLKRAKKSLDAMLNSLEKGNTLDINLPIKEVIEQSQLMMKTPTFLSKDLKEAVYWAMSIVEYSNGMGIICAAPTAGSSGVFPAVLFKAQQMLDKTEEDVMNAFLVGSESFTINFQLQLKELQNFFFLRMIFCCEERYEGVLWFEFLSIFHIS